MTAFDKEAFSKQKLKTTFFRG